MVRVTRKQKIRTLRNLIKNHVYPDKILKQQYMLDRLMMEETHAIFIQKHVRGYLVRLRVKNKGRGSNKDSLKNSIKKTNESQGHGKAIEISIQRDVFSMDDGQIKEYNPTDEHDIRKEHNTLLHMFLKGKNASIKVTCSDIVYCSKISRFINHLFTGSNVIMIVSRVYQFNDKHKKVLKTYLIDIPKIFEQINEEELLNFKSDITTYESYIHGLPNGRISKDYLCKSQELMNKYPNICNILKINTKVDSNKQRRVQCSFNIRSIKQGIIKEFDGSKIYDKKYCELIYSPPRDRHGVTIDKIKSFAKSTGIKGPGKRGGWSNMKKNEILNYIINKGHTENDIIEYYKQSL